MKSWISLPFLVMSLAIAPACKTRKTTTPPVVDNPTPPATPPCPPLSKPGPARESNPISGLSASINGDCIELKVTYSGGCKAHRFDLEWNGAHAESMPPQVNLNLVHSNGGDICRELKNEKLSYDLHNIRYRGVGQVIINLTAEGVPLQRANYTYQPEK